MDIDPTGARAKEIQDNIDLLAEKVAAKDNLKTKITSNPDMIFKGVMFCKSLFTITQLIL